MSIELVEGLESRFYMKKSSLPVIEIKLTSDCEVSSQFNWEANPQ